MSSGAPRVMRFIAPPGRRDGARAARLVAIAFAGSLALHAVLAAVVALTTSTGDGGRSDPFAGQPIVASLATPAQKFAVPAAVQADVRRTELAPPSSVGEPALLPVPMRPSPEKPAAAGTPQGLATMRVLDDDRSSLDARLAELLATLHPDAVHAAPDFVAEPEPRYPAQVLAERRQHEQLVIVVVDQDGRVAPLDGTLGESPFDASVRAALAGARARPAIVDGQPRASWSLARFAWEFVGVRN